MKWPALTAAMLCLGISTLAGGCGGPGDAAKQEPGKAAGQEPTILDKPEYRVRLEEANEAHDRRLAKLSRGLDERVRKDAVKAYRGFGNSLKQLSGDLDEFRPRDDDAANAHEKLIEAFDADVAFVDATDDAIEKDGRKAITRGPLKQRADMLTGNLHEATTALFKSGWAPTGLHFDA